MFSALFTANLVSKTVMPKGEKRKDQLFSLFLKYTYCFCSLKFIENGRDVFINSDMFYVEVISMFILKLEKL